MPRNPTTGIYSKPAGTTPSTGQVIDPAPWNALTTDLGNEITNSLPRDGSAPMVAALKGFTGTSTTPGYTFANDMTTGFYLKSAGVIGIVAGAAEIGTLSTSGLAIRAAITGKTIFAVKTGNYTAVVTDVSSTLRFTAAAILALTAAGTLGDGWYIDVIAAGGDITIDPDGSETVNGLATFVVPKGYCTRIFCDGSAFWTDYLGQRPGPDFVSGLILSNNVSNPNTQIDIGPGIVRGAGLDTSLGATFTKALNALWVAGSGNGGLDAGAIAANATYFAYALYKQADGSADFVFSTSATVGGVTLTRLTGYTVMKCIGVALTDASSLIRQFIMNPRDFYQWVTPIREATSIPISTTSALLAITVPNGVRAEAKLRLMFSSSAVTNSALVHDPAKGTLIAGGNDSGGNVGTIQVASGFAVGGGDVFTNTSKQVRYVSGASGSIWLWNDGFSFPCGRIA